ncbi:hypothetical protein GJ744_005257 [Endocarpon pusillum]|uniref:Uncharacterized protein n=1 Tax=Endocarpon pusillum TaxID=364733 RepID=A0A8H7DZP0_9EURO|nr:hypothetical protein GJ744_005257 [Endocarpon pusillum]
MDPFDAYLQSLASKELTTDSSGGSDTSSSWDPSVEVRMAAPPAKSISRVKKEANPEYSLGAGALTSSDPAKSVSRLKKETNPEYSLGPGALTSSDPATSVSRVKKETNPEYSLEAGASTSSDPAITSLAESIKSDKRLLRLRQQELKRFEAGHPSEQSYHYSMIPTELHNHLEKNVSEAATLLRKHQDQLSRRIRSTSSAPNIWNTKENAQQNPAHQPRRPTSRNQAVKN